VAPRGTEARRLAGIEERDAVSPLPPDLLRDDVQMLLAFAVAFVTALLATPRLRAAALRLGIVDAPDGRLKTQR